MEKGKERYAFRQNYERGRQIVTDAPQLYVDVDIEADGKPGYGSMLSLGAITPQGETFYRELKPQSTLWLPSQREFCEQHGLERERLMDEGIDPVQAIAEFDDWSRHQKDTTGKNGLVFSAFNASFDYPFVDLYYAQANIPSPYGVAGYCIKSLAQALNLDAYNWRKTTKSQLPHDITPHGDFTHHALEDAIWQQKLHFALVGKLAREKATN